MLDKKVKNKQKRPRIGLIEPVEIFGQSKTKIVMAKIDTGADRSSVSVKLAADLGLGPITKTRTIKTSTGREIRAIIKAKIKIGNKIFRVFFSITDRAHMKYPVLIGKNILKKGFLIDPLKKR